MHRLKTTALTSLTAVGLTCVGGLSSSASAAIVDLTNGDFETSAVNGNDGFPSPWYSGHPNNWKEFRYAGLGSYTGTAAAFGENGATDQDGYFYQQVGTYGGELSVTVDGTAYNRNSSNILHVFGDFDVAFYYTTGLSFSPAEGTDIASSGTLIGSVQEFQEGVNLPGLTSGAGGTSSAFSYTALFGGSGISLGDAVWVRFSDSDNIFGGNVGAAINEPYLDDLSVSAVVPEPGSLALFGLGGLGFLCRRRNA